MTDPPRKTEVTKILLGLNRGGGDDPEMTARLLELLYPELRRIAAGIFRKERSDHTLQPTALVHEAYLKLVDQSKVEWQDRSHFLGIASRAMRQALVDHARKRSAAKRGGDWQRVTFEEEIGLGGQDPLELLALDDLLTALTGISERAGRVAEMRIFGGMTIKDVAESLGVSKRTVDDDWAVARMWLARALKENQG